MLLAKLLEIMGDWRLMFPQDRTFRRAVRQSVGSMCSLGRRTISRALCCLGRDQQDWSADYRVHSRSKWDDAELFEPILRRAHPLCGEEYVSVGFDDGHLKKTGRMVPGASYWADPLSPPFRVNLMWGLRYLQASLFVPHYRTSEVGARGLPIRFREVPAVKRPGKRASAEEREAYRQAVKEHNMSTAFVQELRALRTMLDRAGGETKKLVVALDGSFCNRACFGADVERVLLVARARRDAKLCAPAPQGGRRVYDAHKFTPESVRQDESVPWRVTRIFHGGCWRDVRYKDIEHVLWQGGTRRKPLRLFVIAPTPYKVRPNGRTFYRQPAYLFCTDCAASVDVVLQAYFDRWQIEVNHREQKDTLGVGQAQVWSEKSVPRQPALMVASYSALLLAAIEVYGSQRTDAFMKLPKWRNGSSRPSLLDLITQVRREIADEPACAAPFELTVTLEQLVLTAAA